MKTKLSNIPGKIIFLLSTNTQIVVAGNDSPEVSITQDFASKKREYKLPQPFHPSFDHQQVGWQAPVETPDPSNKTDGQSPSTASDHRVFATVSGNFPSYSSSADHTATPPLVPHSESSKFQPTTLAETGLPLSSDKDQIRLQSSFDADHAVQSFYQGYTYCNVQTPLAPQFKTTSQNSQTIYAFHPDLHSEHTINAEDTVPYSFIQNKSQFTGEGLICGIEPQTNSSSTPDSEDDESPYHSHTQSQQSATSLTLLSEDWQFALLESLDHLSTGTTSEESLLACHLLHQFNTSEFADCLLKVSIENRKSDKAEFFLHILLVVQSPFLNDLIEATALDKNGLKSLHVSTCDRFITPSAIQTTLQTFYGKSPFSFNGYPSPTPLGCSRAETLILWMDNALAFIAAGHLFQVTAIIQRGLFVASTILSLENVERALAFILDGALNENWDSNDILGLKGFSPPSTSIKDGSPFATNDSNDHDCDVSNDSYAGLSFLRLKNPYQKHIEQYTEFMNVCLELVVSEISKDWELDLRARPLADADRIPTTVGSRSPLSKSMLSKIQFGDHPSESTLKFGNKNVIISSILLSLPFILLKHVLNHIEKSLMCKIIRPLIEERERRRRLVLKNSSESMSLQGAGAARWAQVEWEEYVLEEDSATPNLSRRWKGTC